MRLKLSVRYKVWGFPYKAEEKDTSVNHGYFDCKKEPGRISEIPEVKEWPEMERFIRDVCSAGSLFRTLGCDVGFSKETDGFIHVKSYVDVAFEILRMNFHKVNYYLVFDRLSDAIRQQSIPDSVVANCSVQYTVFNDHAIEGESNTWAQGWSLVFRLDSAAVTAEDARLHWGSALDVIRHFLIEMSEENSWELEKGHQTIS